MRRRPVIVPSVLRASLMLAAQTLTAAAAWWPVYESASFLLMAGTTVVVGTGIGAAGARWSWPAPVVAAASSAAWLLLGVPLALPAKAFAGVLPTPAGLADVAVTTATGWRQLLTIELPVGSFQALLVPAFVLLLTASVLGTSVATRSRMPALAVLFPLAVLVAGIAFGAGAGTAFAPIAVGGLFTVLLVLWLAASARWSANARALAQANPDAPGSTRAGRGQTAGGSSPGAGSSRASRSSRGTPGSAPRRGRALTAAAAVTALAVLTSVGVAAALPATDRAVLRDAIAQPFDSSRAASPLAGFRAFVKPPVADAVVLTVTGLASGSRITVARMDDYDGVVFGVGSATSTPSLFSRVPGALSGGSGSGAGAGAASGEAFETRITVGDYEGVWVPTTGDPLAIDFRGADAAALQDSLYYSAGLQTAATTTGLTEGDSYDLRAQPLAVSGDPAGLTPGVLPTAGTEPAAVGVAASADVLPDALSTRLAEWAPDSLSPGARLQGVLSGLRSGYRSSGLEGEVFSRSGHGTERLHELLTATPMVGDAEQYAAASALLARAAGFPSRVALGFVVPATAVGVADPSTVDSPDAAGVADAGADGAPEEEPIAVRGQDATAWLEVFTAEDGWVALDPVPDLRPIPESAQEDTRTAVQPPEVVPPPSDELDDPGETAPSQQDEEAPPASDDVLATVLRIAGLAGIVLAALAVLLAPFLTVVAMKARRRRRRRTEGPARARAAGSWAELLDAARDAAVPLAANATRRESGQVLDAAVGSEQPHPADAGPADAGPADAPARSHGSVALAVRVDGALYSPIEPDEAELRALWLASDERRRALLAGRGRFARLRARVSTRSMRPYHGRDRKRRS